jgi:hypothetical protein
MTRRAKRRALVIFRSLVILFGATTLVALGCTGDLITPPPQCTGPQCSCDQDPLQPLCKGFNDRPEGGVIDMSDAQKVDANDGAIQPDTSTTPDAESDASSDAADDGG